MPHFPVQLKPGHCIAGQVVFAVKRAVATGALKPGAPFPSVRALSRELRINPNTAHKIVAALGAEGVIVTTPAVGSVVAQRARAGLKKRAALLGDELERLVVAAKQRGITKEELHTALAAHWTQLVGQPSGRV